MKISGFLVAATALLVSAPGILASPIETSPNPNSELAARWTTEKACYHKSSCGFGWSGKCEEYCGKRKFAYMVNTGCGVRWRKRCCCKK
ncbi:hypothetical protein ACJ72_07300 [Emergomyces africanus]|uniref:Invertebrate defensins family profile domain-containing protein n=1 Tax=Emergomyces africanus TaxID=1955775 RepID=A0A1B7NNJ7_9EURO|nr:hypothetical protein ACJ72_07300 [Emergomyces africanus]